MSHQSSVISKHKQNASKTAMRPIYLDHNATSPLDPEVFEAMRPHWLAVGNPESRHSFGRAARLAYEQARETVARILNADPLEVFFTSGGTESNNLSLFGLAHLEGRKSTGGHVVSSPIEHPAVAEVIDQLEGEGYSVDRPEVSLEGVADANRMAEAFRPETRLATLILAHNETGAIQPVARLADRAAELGIPVHTDAVQAVGRIPLDFQRLGVATLAASAHKFQGPPGVGLLLIRQGVKPAPLLFGGGQERGRRPGTPALALAVGLAAALEKWEREAETRIKRWATLRDRLEAGLIAKLGPEGIVRNGPTDTQPATAARLPQTLHVSFPRLDGDALLMQLDLAGVACSLGSACASGTTKPSPSLQAMRLPADHLRSSVRFSLGATTTEQEIEEAIQRVAQVVRRVKEAEAIETASA